ncbi:hypothetical protein [Desulfonatronum thiosulfatophilum]|uniref:hypothetical protein n=1 Tax=Desulfonatronum thiosulfatophilum TaxID=617002 RepID=UPI001114198A|nr:hypothetical protein [Desulfonatronum thiosulfatophilum]
MAWVCMFLVVQYYPGGLCLNAVYMGNSGTCLRGIHREVEDPERRVAPPPVADPVRFCGLISVFYPFRQPSGEILPYRSPTARASPLLIILCFPGSSEKLPYIEAGNQGDHQDVKPLSG